MEIVNMGKNPINKKILLNSKGGLIGEGECPNCHKPVSCPLVERKNTYSWCKWCGQRILWAGEDNHKEI